MKQFSLEEFKKNPNRKVVAENGRSARIICTDAKGRFPVIALVFDVENDYEDIYFYTPNGECSDISDGPMNLFFAPVKKSGWVNLYRTEGGRLIFGNVHCAKEIAIEEYEKTAKTSNTCKHIDTIQIEWEE